MSFFKIYRNLLNYNDKLLASAATGTTVRDDPFADIRITSGRGYAAKDCTITGNQYFNNLEIQGLTYKFVNENQAATTTNTIENNTKLDARKNGFLEDKATVLATYSQLFGNYNKSEYKANVRTGTGEAFPPHLSWHGKSTQTAN